ncbi:unnamed protein product [Discosporangium mesarthrocarpum]
MTMANPEQTSWSPDTLPKVSFRAVYAIDGLEDLACPRSPVSDLPPGGGSGFPEPQGRSDRCPGAKVEPVAAQGSPWQSKGVTLHHHGHGRRGSGMALGSGRAMVELLRSELRVVDGAGVGLPAEKEAPFPEAAGRGGKEGVATRRGGGAADVERKIQPSRSCHLQVGVSLDPRLCGGSPQNEHQALCVKSPAPGGRDPRWQRPLCELVWQPPCQGEGKGEGGGGCTARKRRRHRGRGRSRG